MRDVEDGYPLGLISRDRQFESGSRNSSYLTPICTVTAIRIFREIREWWRKQRRTCNGGVPKTKETRHMGDHMLVTNLHQFGFVAQLNRAPDYGSGGLRFESLRGHKNA